MTWTNTVVSQSVDAFKQWVEDTVSSAKLVEETMEALGPEDTWGVKESESGSLFTMGDGERLFDLED